jgi:hypothetical protein
MFSDMHLKEEFNDACLVCVLSMFERLFVVVINMYHVVIKDNINYVELISYSSYII